MFRVLFLPYIQNWLRQVAVELHELFLRLLLLESLLFFVHFLLLLLVSQKIVFVCHNLNLSLNGGGNFVSIANLAFTFLLILKIPLILERNPRVFLALADPCRSRHTWSFRFHFWFFLFPYFLFCPWWLLHLLFSYQSSNTSWSLFRSNEDLEIAKPWSENWTFFMWPK